jgi:acyl dehydratase
MAGFYWEDFTPGDVLVHKRGRTMGESEHMAWTSRLMNTAEIHFNRALTESDPAMREQSEGRLLIYGGLVLSFCMGLSTGETTEHALQILGLDEARHTAGVYAGDTLFAKTEVLEKRDAGRPDAGIVKFKLIGLKQDRKTVCLEAVYEALIEKKTNA